MDKVSVYEGLIMSVKPIMHTNTAHSELHIVTEEVHNFPHYGCAVQLAESIYVFQ